MVRRISQRLHWPKREHEQKLEVWSEPAIPVVPAPPETAQAAPASPPWILPPVAKAEPRPEARA